MCILKQQIKAMNRENLSTRTEILLSSIERDSSAPHYTEATFQRKVATSNRRAMDLPLPISGKEANYLLQREWADVIENALLTERQLAVLCLRLEGHTFEDIGRIGGHTKQGAQNIFFQAAKKLVRAWMEYPYRSLAQVYKDEVRRGSSIRHRVPRKNT